MENFVLKFYITFLRKIKSEYSRVRTLKCHLRKIRSFEMEFGEGLINLRNELVRIIKEI